MEKLKSYLVTRLLVMTAAVLAAENGALYLVRRVLLPAAASVAQYGEDVRTFRLLDAFRILIGTVFGHGENLVLGFLSRSTAFFLLMLAFILLLLPAAIGILWYANLITTKIDQFQQERENERAAFDAQRNLMFSDFAHDLRTPIMTISGYAGALADGVVKDEAQKQEYLTAIRSKADRMAGLISLLFEYTKLGSVHFSLQKEPVDLNELLRDAAASVYTDIEDAGMDFLIEIPETPYTVQADRAQLSRVITNLLTNAVRHNPAGTQVALSVKQMAGVEMIAVADTGVAIEKSPEQLFEPFVKGDDSRGSVGSGLGLSIAKKIAEMHGYTLELRQPFGNYTKAFILTVPERAGERE